jgi:hypothetical protein
MSDRSRTEGFDPRAPQFRGQCPPLPWWIADRLLRPDEKVDWVYGPKANPPWERYVTHPALFLAALVLGALCFGAGLLVSVKTSEIPMIPCMAAVLVVIGSVFVLAFSNAYFTRLVVTNTRLVVLQGYEVCRSWHIDDLPRSLVRYGRPGAAEDPTLGPSIDLEALQTMLGGASDRFAESKTILAFGKRLDQIKSREDHRP